MVGGGLRGSGGYGTVGGMMGYDVGLGVCTAAGELDDDTGSREPQDGDGTDRGESKSGVETLWVMVGLGGGVSGIGELD